MFESLMEERKELLNRTKYTKNLGWKEMDSEGNMKAALLNVVDTTLGYGVFRQGTTLELIYWSKDLEEAVEWAVDRARKEIADHEVKAQKREG